MRNAYLLCFSEPIPLSEVEDIFHGEDDAVAVSQKLPTTFALASNMSPSTMRFTLKSYYDGQIIDDPPARCFTLAVVRSGSELLTYRSNGFSASDA